MFDTTAQIRTIVAQQLHTSSSCLEWLPVGGGCINKTFQVISNKKQHFFCKVNSVTAYPGLFEKEQNGLRLLANQGIFRIPEIAGFAVSGEFQILILEWIAPASPTAMCWKNFGRQLAQLHQVTETVFGLEEDNYMGALPQSNTIADSWIVFFVQHRLEPGIRMAFDKNLLTSKHRQQFDALYKRLPAIFSPEPPALLHGDLWRGNFICDIQQQPVLIDPAVYFGHRSADLAMTTLFGGFDPLFYEAYHYHYPLPSNYRQQWEISNLYPMLVHLILFGVGYRADIEAILHTYQ